MLCKKGKLALFFALFSCIFLSSAKPKQEIADCLHEFTTASQQGKAEAALKLSLAYLDDQDQENGIKAFIAALQATPSRPTPQVSEQEKELFDKGLAIYLGRTRESSPQEIAVNLYQNFKQVCDQHPEYYLLNLLMSTAYANLNRYREFFTTFYRSYPYYQDHYLSYKTKAALHIRLFEKAPKNAEREIEREGAYQNIVKAIEANPSDLSLFKAAMLFAPESNRPELVKFYMLRIIDQKIPVPRSDIAFFVRQAIETKQIDIAQKFVDKSREWYQYSRSVNEAQEYIDQHR